MRKLQEHDNNQDRKPDTIDILINVCRVAALIFAALAVYLINVKQQAVLWPAIVSIAFLVGGVILGNMPQKIDTEEGKKDKKNW